MNTAVSVAIGVASRGHVRSSTEQPATPPAPPSPAEQIGGEKAVVMCVVPPTRLNVSVKNG